LIADDATSGILLRGAFQFFPAWGNAHVTELLVPRSRTELKAVAGTGRLIAGGTDLLVRIRSGSKYNRLIDVTNLADAPASAVRHNRHVELSALAPISRVTAALDGILPGVAAAARVFASVQIRNRATIGGNIANASPAADMLPPLVAAGAVAHIEGVEGERTLSVEELVVGPGQTGLAEDEWIRTIDVPIAEGEDGFCKLGGRSALAISVVSLAWRWHRAGDGRLSGVRLALGAVAPRVRRAPAAEALLEGRLPTSRVVDAAAAALGAATEPIDDVRASAWYRSEVACELLRMALQA
jgi:CO/xanthine dehydrogenase FAD-binding subunit